VRALFVVTSNTHTHTRTHTHTHCVRATPTYSHTHTHKAGPVALRCRAVVVGAFSVADSGPNKVLTRIELTFSVAFSTGIVIYSVVVSDFSSEITPFLLLLVPHLSKDKHRNAVCVMMRSERTHYILTS